MGHLVKNVLTHLRKVRRIWTGTVLGQMNHFTFSSLISFRKFIDFVSKWLRRRFRWPCGFRILLNTLSCYIKLCNSFVHKEKILDSKYKDRHALKTAVSSADCISSHQNRQEKTHSYSWTKSQNSQESIDSWRFHFCLHFSLKIFEKIKNKFECFKLANFIFEWTILPGWSSNWVSQP